MEVQSPKTLDICEALWQSLEIDVFFKPVIDRSAVAIHSVQPVLSAQGEVGGNVDGFCKLGIASSFYWNRAKHVKHFLVRRLFVLMLRKSGVARVPNFSASMASFASSQSRSLPIGELATAAR